MSPHLASFKHELQAGSLPGVGTDTLLLLARAAQGIGKAQRRRTALLFFDIRAAYYQLLRQLATDIHEDDAELLRLFHRMNVPAEALQELREHLQAMSAVAAAGASPHLAAIAADLFRGSWFRLEGHTAIALTRRGTRPGDPTADVIYAFCLAALHRCMDTALDAAGLLPRVPLPTTPPLLPDLPVAGTVSAASWPDDCVRFCAEDGLDALLKTTVATLEKCFEKATSMGVEFSCGPHKTAVLISDPMARGISRCSDGQMPEVLLVRNRLLQCTVEVGIVPAYKYLGGVVTSDGLPRLEILHRKALAAGIARPLARRFFSNGSIPLETRRTILNALSVSRFVYGSISLHLTCPQHRRIWYQSYLALWRVLSRSDKSTHHKPHACFVLQAARAPSPPLAMAYMQATFLRRLVRHGPFTLVAVLQRHWELSPAGSWLGRLVGDVAFSESVRGWGQRAVGLKVHRACAV